MSRRFERFAPLVTGVLMIVLAVVGTGQDGSRSGPSTTEPGTKVLAYLHSHNGGAASGAFSLLLAAVAGTFFFGLLRHVLSTSRPAEWLATIGFGGSILLSVAALVEAGIDFAFDDVGTNVDASTVQVLNVLQSDLNTMLIQAGLCIALVGFGLAIRRSERIPHWAGWPTVLIGVLSIAGPLIVVALPLAALWTIGISVLLAIQSPSPLAATPGDVAIKTHA